MQQLPRSRLTSDSEFSSAEPKSNFETMACTGPHPHQTSRPCPAQEPRHGLEFQAQRQLFHGILPVQRAASDIHRRRVLHVDTSPKRLCSALGEGIGQHLAEDRRNRDSKECRGDAKQQGHDQTCTTCSTVARLTQSNGSLHSSSTVSPSPVVGCLWRG